MNDDDNKTNSEVQKLLAKLAREEKERQKSLEAQQDLITKTSYIKMVMEQQQRSEQVMKQLHRTEQVMEQQRRAEQFLEQELRSKQSVTLVEESKWFQRLQKENQQIEYMRSITEGPKWLREQTRQNEQLSHLIEQKEQSELSNKWKTGAEIFSPLIGRVEWLRSSPVGNIPTTYSSDATIRLEKEINELKTLLANKANELEEKKFSEDNLNIKIQELELTQKKLFDKERCKLILESVSEAGETAILNSAELQNLFLIEKQCDAYVLSADIRKSTELMLRARSPQHFADFIIALNNSFEKTIKESYGVFDKFTGDGFLAYYPEAYSGSDAGFHMIKAAIDCHKAFSLIYREHRNCFNTVLKDVGLGIGIDYGRVNLAQFSGKLTVVGHAVVYACRMSSAPADQTYLNITAYELLSKKYGDKIEFADREIPIKHEGLCEAYSVEKFDDTYKPTLPKWANSPTDIENKP